MWVALGLIALGWLMRDGPDRVWLWFSETPTQRAKRLASERIQRERAKRLIDV